MDLPNNSKGEHYNLRWNNYTTNLIQVFSEHQHHETLVDVTLSCEGQFVKAHKLILSACSSFFQEMFKIHGFVQHPFIVLSGIKFSHLKHILEFIYHGEVKILDEDLEGVLALGESFKIKGLSSVKIKHQTPTPTPDQNRPSRAVSVPVNTVPTTYQQAQNTLESPRNEDRPREQTNRNNKRVQAVDRVRTEGIQNRVGIQNGKEAIEPALKRTRTPETATTSSADPVSNQNVEGREIPKPTNPFMIFTNEWRNKLAVEHPDENNKAISVMLGNMWKSLSAETKESYYLAANRAQREHELKYPSDVNNSPERKKGKAIRRKTIDCTTQMTPVDTAEIAPGKNNDLEVIEILEDPIDVSGTGKPSHP